MLSITGTPTEKVLSKQNIPNYGSIGNTASDNQSTTASTSTATSDVEKVSSDMHQDAVTTGSSDNQAPNQDSTTAADEQSTSPDSSPAPGDGLQSLHYFPGIKGYFDLPKSLLILLTGSSAIFSPSADSYQQLGSMFLVRFFDVYLKYKGSENKAAARADLLKLLRKVYKLLVALNGEISEQEISQKSAEIQTFINQSGSAQAAKLSILSKLAEQLNLAKQPNGSEPAASNASMFNVADFKQVFTLTLEKLKGYEINENEAGETNSQGAKVEKKLTLASYSATISAQFAQLLSLLGVSGMGMFSTSANVASELSSTAASTANAGHQQTAHDDLVNDVFRGITAAVGATALLSVHNAHELYKTNSTVTRLNSKVVELEETKSQQAAEIAALKKVNSDQAAKITEQDKVIAGQNKKITDQAAEIAVLKETNCELRKKVAAQETKLAAQETKLAAQETKLAAQETKIAAQETKIAAQSERLSKLEKIIEGLVKAQTAPSMQASTMAELGLFSSDSQSPEGPSSTSSNSPN